METMPELQALIRDSETVLNTQAEQAGEIIDFSSDLRVVTEALRDSDSDLNRLISTAPEFADETQYLVENSGEPLTRSFTNLAETTRVVDPFWPSFRILGQLLPALSAGGLSVAPGDGTIHMGVVFEKDNPPPCTTGYERTYEIIEEMRAQNPEFDPLEMDFPVNYDADCRAPYGSPSAVRGAHSADYADPSVPQPWDNKPKIDPDALNLSVAAEQLARAQGLIPQ